MNECMNICVCAHACTCACTCTCTCMYVTIYIYTSGCLYTCASCIHITFVYICARATAFTAVWGRIHHVPEHTTTAPTTRKPGVEPTICAQYYSPCMHACSCNRDIFSKCAKHTQNPYAPGRVDHPHKVSAVYARVFHVVPKELLG